MAKTKVETLFSDDEVAQLFKELQGLPAGQRTGRFVNEWASKRGHYVSKQSGINTVKGPFQDYLDELKTKRDMAENVSAVAKSGLGLTDAAASNFAARVFDASLTLGSDEIGGKKANNISLAIARLQAGDQRATYLETKVAEIQQKMDLQQFDAATAVLAHAKEIKLIIADKSLDGPARTERVRKILFGDKPADFKPVTDRGAQKE